MITQNFDNGLITNINKGGKSEVITDGGLSVHVDGGDWVQKVQNGKIDISSPNAVHIKSDSSVTIDAPTQLVTAKGYNIAFTGISISGTGKSISMNAVSTSINGASFSWTPLSISTSLASVVHAPMNYQRSLTKIEDSIQNLAIGVIHMFI